MLKITQKKGLVGATQTQKATIASLGLHKIHQTVTHQDNAAIRGQIRKVAHLVEVEEVK